MRNIGILPRGVFLLLMAQTVQAQPGQAFHRRDYAFFTAEYILEGSGWLIVDGRYYDVEAGDLYLLPPGRDHEYAADRQTPWRKIFFNIGGTLPACLIDCYGLNTFHIPDWPEVALFQQMQALSEHPGADVQNEGALLLHRLIARAAELTTSDAATPVDAARAFIEDNLHHRIRLADIARACFLSPSQLTRIFRAATGCTPYDFLCRRRIERARQLLRGTDLPVREIAERLQFADPFYFSGAFKRATGYSPRRYRELPDPEQEA